MTKQAGAAPPPERYFWRWRGGFATPNIPARNISQDEADEKGLTEALAISPLYERVAVPAKKDDN